MQDFSAFHRALDVVDSLPGGTAFDYSNPCHCVFGLAVQHSAEYGVRGRDLVQLKKTFGLNDDQLVTLYGGMIVTGAMPASYQTDRRACVQAMRRLVAKWQAEQACAEAAEAASSPQPPVREPLPA